MDAGVALSVWEATEYFSSGGVAPKAMGSAHRMSAPYQAVRCADGFITLAAANDRLFARLAEGLGHPEWTEMDEFATDASRVAHRASLAARIEAVTTLRPRAEWLERFDACGVPCGPINDYAQVFADPHIAARGLVRDVEHPALGRLRTLGSPVRFSETSPVVDRPAPLLGQHTHDVLKEAGLSDEEISALGEVG